MAHGALFVCLAALLIASSGQSQPAERQEETVRRRIPIAVPASPRDDAPTTTGPSLQPPGQAGLQRPGPSEGKSPTPAETQPVTALSTSGVAPAAEKTQPEPSTTAKTPAEYYGLATILPALVAIVLAVATRQVIPSLALGILSASIMLSILAGQYSPIDVIQRAVRDYLLGVFIPAGAGDPAPGETLRDQIETGYNHLRIIVFTQFIGGMVGIVSINGGTRAMVEKVTHMMRGARSGQLGAWLSGLIIFFDDYANAMIIGPAMRPVFDRLKISRAKLAYIVDSTAAPVASVFIGTWLAAEIDFLGDGLKALDSRPAFLADMTGSTAFWSSIPYRTYAWMAIFFVFIVAVMRRDFGPMRTSEARALSGSSAASVTSIDESPRCHWLVGFLPVFVLVAMTLSLLLITGHQTSIADEITLEPNSSVSGVWSNITTLLGKADSYTSLLYAGLAAVSLAAVLSVFFSPAGLSKSMDGMTNGMMRIFSAQIVLILAWGLSTSILDLQFDKVASSFLQAKVESGHFDQPLLPTVIFITAAIVSFATGTSWGTMGILCPTTIAISASLLAPLPEAQAMPLFYASVGAVLTGAVFGDHCSPISDTTVLSAMASECDLTEHVRTQLPYALVIAVVGLLSTDVLDYALIKTQPEFYAAHWNVYYGTAIAALLLTIILFVFGRRPAPALRVPVTTPMPPARLT